MKEVAGHGSIESIEDERAGFWEKQADSNLGESQTISRQQFRENPGVFTDVIFCPWSPMQSSTEEAPMAPAHTPLHSLLAIRGVIEVQSRSNVKKKRQIHRRDPEEK